MAKKVIKFWAPWCGPCNSYTPAFQNVKQELQSEQIEFVEVNVEEDPEGLTADYKVKGIPCTVILQDGVEVARRA